VKYAKVKPDAAGRILIPREFRKALGIKTGEYVVLQLEDGELRVYTMNEAVRRSAAQLDKYIPQGRSLVDELIAERRAAAQLE
jgi:AbrB family looped-hinge helix DNA binding protein